MHDIVSPRLKPSAISSIEALFKIILRVVSDSLKTIINCCILNKSNFVFNHL